MRGWGLPWLLLGLAGNAIGPGADPPLRIQGNAPLTRTLASGEIHVYNLTLDAGDYARVEIVQQGLDVEAVLRDSSGSEVVRVDSPTGSFSTESVSLIAEEKGEYSIEVRTVFKGGTGEYRLHLVSLHRADQDDRLRVEAERTDLQAYQGIYRGGQEAADAARTAVERWRALGDRLHEARALTTLGIIQDRSGAPREALATYEQALSIQRELKDRQGMAETLNQLGKTRGLLGDDQGALEALQESTSLWQDLDRPDSASATLLNAGQVHQDSGDTSAAVGAYEQAFALAIRAGERRRQAEALNSLGQMHISLGEPLLALDELRKALDLARATGRSKIEAEVLANLGTASRNLGMPHEALEHFIAAREIFQKRGQTEEEGSTLNNLGILLFELGALEDARGLLLQALPMRRDPREKADTLVGLSWVAERQGDTHEASSRLDQALGLQRGVGYRTGEAETLRAQGLLRLTLGEPERAEALLRESLAIFQELRRPASVAAARRGLARVYAAQGRLDLARSTYEEARKQSEELGDVGAQLLTLAEQARLEHENHRLPAARERLEKAIELMEDFRSEVGGDRLRALHFATIRETYERYVDVLMQLHKAGAKPGLDAKAFEVAEQSRSRGLLDVLTRARVDTREGDPELLAEELRLRQELNAKAALLMSLADDEASRVRSEALRKEIDTLTTEHRVAEALLTDGSSYESLKKPSVPIQEIQGLLDGETILLEYLLAEPRSYLWAVTSTSLKAFELPGRSEIEPLIRRLHEHLRDPGERDVSGQRNDLDLLAKQVLGPALGDVAGRLRLVIVADGALQYIPFAALPGRESSFLVEEHEIVLLPSAAVLKEIRKTSGKRPPRPASLAILADPLYNDPDKGVRPRLVVNRSSVLADLPWSRREAEGIKAVAQARDPLLLLGADVSRDLVTSGRLESFSTLHFATHGFLDSEQPELSGLALSQLDRNGKPVDGFLRLQDLYSLRLQSDLVVLSGCETGLGRELRGEGLVGMTHGFFHAGASQVVASLWSVRDRATADLMQSFYRSMLSGGLRPAAALRAAQTEMLTLQRNRRDPYYWAAFVAQGDWTAGGL